MADLSASISIGLDAAEALRDAKRLDDALESLKDRAQSVNRAMRRAFDLSGAWTNARNEVAQLDARLRTLQNTLNGVERRADRAAAAVASIGGNFQRPIDNLLRFQRALDGIERRAHRTAQTLSSMAANTQAANAAVPSAAAQPAAAPAANTTASTNAQNALLASSQQATSAVSQLGRAITDMARRADAASRQLARSMARAGQGAATGGTGSTSGAVGMSAPQISTAGVSNALGGLRRGAVDLAQAFGRLNQNTGQLEETFENLFMVLAAGVALADVARAGVELHAYGQTLESVTQSTEEANRAWDTLSAQSDRLGIFVNDLRENFAQFIVAGRSAGLTLDETSAVFFNFAEAMESTGAPIDQVQAGLEALQDIMTSGALDESGMAALQKAFPAALQTMADAVAGGDFSRLREMMEDEVLGGRDAVLAFVETAINKFPLSTEAASQAMNEFNRFRTAFEELKQTVANGGFLDSLAEAARRLTEAFRSEEIRTMAASLGQDLAGAVQTLTPYVITAVKHIDDLALALGGLIAFKLTVWAAGIASSLGGIAIAAYANWPVVLAAGVAAAGAAFVYFLRDTGSVEGALDRLGDVAGTVIQKFGDFTGISDNVRAAWASLNEASGGQASQVADDLSRAISGIGEAADTAKPAVVSFFEQFSSDFMAGINRDMEAFGRMMADLPNMFGDIPGRVQNVFNTLSGYYDALKTKANETAARVGMPDLRFDTLIGFMARDAPGMLEAFRMLDGGMQDFVGKTTAGLLSLPDKFRALQSEAENAANSIATAAGRMGDAVSNFADDVGTWMRQAADSMRSAFDQAVGEVVRRFNDFQNGVSAVAERVRQLVSDVGNSIATSINFDVVQRSVDAFSTGIQQAIELVRTAANGVAGFFAPAIGALEAFASRVQGVWNWMKGNAPPMPDGGGGVQLQSGQSGFAQRSGFQQASFITSDVMPTRTMSEGDGAVAPKPERVIRNAPQISPRAAGAEGAPQVIPDTVTPGKKPAPPPPNVALPGKKPTPPPVPPGTPRPTSTRAGERAPGGMGTPTKPPTGPTSGKAFDLTKRFNEQLSEFQAQARGLQGISAAYDQGTAAAGKFRREQDLLEKVQRLNSEFKPKQVEALRTELEKIQNLEIDIDFKQSLSELDDRTKATKQLSEAQAAGGDAVREAQAGIEAYNEAVRLGIADDEARIETLKEKHQALLNLQAVAAVDADLRNMRFGSEQTGRMISAMGSRRSGAVREAEIENRAQEMGRQRGVENDPVEMGRIRAAQEQAFDDDAMLTVESTKRDNDIESRAIGEQITALTLVGEARAREMAAVEARAELARTDIQLTQEQRDAYIANAEQLAAMEWQYGQANDALAQMADSARSGMGALRDAAASSLGHLEDALVGIVTGAMSAKEAMRNMAASIAADLARIAIRQMIIAPLAGMFGMGMMPMGFAQGGVMGPGGGIPVRAFAGGGSMLTPTGVGGIARQPKMSLFGEGDTDEAYVPLTAKGNSEIPLKQLSNGDYVVELPGGRSIPAEMQAFAQGGAMGQLPQADMPAMDNRAMPAIPNEGGDTTNIAPNITVNVQMPQGGGSPEEGQRFGQAISRQIESRVIEIMRNQTRNGGILNPNGGY